MVNGQVPARPAPRRSDAGHVRLSERDVAGLLLCAEHYAAPSAPAVVAGCGLWLAFTARNDLAPPPGR